MRIDFQVTELPESLDQIQLYHNLNGHLSIAFGSDTLLEFNDVALVELSYYFEMWRRQGFVGDFIYISYARGEDELFGFVRRGEMFEFRSPIFPKFLVLVRTEEIISSVPDFVKAIENKVLDIRQNH